MDGRPKQTPNVPVCRDDHGKAQANGSHTQVARRCDLRTVRCELSFTGFCGSKDCCQTQLSVQSIPKDAPLLTTSKLLVAAPHSCDVDGLTVLHHR
jgi:hypothetical protein